MTFLGSKIARADLCAHGDRARKVSVRAVTLSFFWTPRVYTGVAHAHYCMRYPVDIHKRSRLTLVNGLRQARNRRPRACRLQLLLWRVLPQVQTHGTIVAAEASGASWRQLPTQRRSATAKMSAMPVAPNRDHIFRTASTQRQPRAYVRGAVLLAEYQESGHPPSLNPNWRAVDPNYLRAGGRCHRASCHFLLADRRFRTPREI
jgi:hypothetical protein